MHLRVADTFIDNLAQLTGDEQKAVTLSPARQTKG